MENIKIGILGLGRIGKIHMDNLKTQISGAEIFMVSDPLYSIKNNGILTGPPEEVINHPEIDAILICSPTDTHADYIMQCALAGKHIFCEKPHDLSLDRVLESLAVVEESGVKFMLGFNRRFDPNFQKIHSLVASGKVGEPHLIKITSRDPEPPSLDYLMKSGGMFLDMSIHDFDMARFIMGKEVREVFACGGVFTSEDVRKAGDIDTAVITLKFEDGSMAVIDNCRKAVYGYDQRLEVFGSLGMAKVDNNKPDNHVLYNEVGTHGSLPLNFFLERYTTSYLLEMQMFIKSIQSNTKVPVSGYDGLKAMLIAQAALKSLETNQPVIIDDINLKVKKLIKE